MKKVLLVLLIGMSLITTRAQTIPSEEDVNSFFNTKTMVVLLDNPLREYNSVIREVMEQEWNITEYEFIDFAKFEELRKDPQYSFLYMTEVGFENDKTDARYRFLHLSLGGDYFRVGEMPDIASVPLSYHSVEEDNYIYKLAVLVRFIQQHATLIRDNPKIISSNVLQHYNDNIQDIKGKTLYLLEDELSPDVNSTARIKKIYPYKFKIVTKDDIEDAIAERDQNVVFLHKVGPEGTKKNARCYKVIIGAADANFYYFDYHKISDKKPDGILKDDFKKMGKN